VRAFAWFVGAIVLAGVLCACVAYPAYELTTAFANFAFHRVAGRIAMLVLVAELVWVCRHLHLHSRRDYGYGLPWRTFLGRSLTWGAIGMLSAGLGAAFLLQTGLRVRDPHFLLGLPSIARIFAVGLSSGIAVALIEETLMRGAMHTAIEAESGPWAAALLTAPLFAVLHLYAKVRIPAAELGWHSGLDLLARSFAPLAHIGMVYDTLLSWLIVGLILSLTRVLTGNIAAAIGLHAGWVVILRMLQEATMRGGTPQYAMWVGRFDGLLGLWLVPWGVCMLAALWLSRSLWSAP
jgi:membrane protease YdiL (CAAX protease family)